jgi:hypothetical protein
MIALIQSMIGLELIAALTLLPGFPIARRLSDDARERLLMTMGASSLLVYDVFTVIYLTNLPYWPLRTLPAASALVAVRHQHELKAMLADRHVSAALYSFAMVLGVCLLATMTFCTRACV